MEAQEIKRLLDQTGMRIVNKFIRDQQTMVDSFKAEVSRSLDSILGALLKEGSDQALESSTDLKEEVSDKK